MAIVFAIKKFNRYLYGKEFTIVTDHQALSEIFNPSRHTPAVAAARLQRWSIILSMYKYKIVHRSGKKMGNVDGLSRLPLPTLSNVEEIQSVNFLNFSDKLPITCDDIRESMQSHSVLQRVYSMVQSNSSCLKKDEEILLPYKSVWKSLSTENGCLFYGDRIVVPDNLQHSLLNWLHENHLGIVRMKMVARSYVWWPKIDKSIEEFVGQCLTCQSTQNVRKEILTSKWEKCTYPFQRVQIDFFHFNGRTFLLIVDAYSKYLDIKIMGRTDCINVTEQ